MAESQPQANQAAELGSRIQGTFVGRQREMGELKAALEEALSGQGRLVMLAGEPGIGKTRTARELASHAESQGTQVLWGWCYEEAGAPPYWPWFQPLRSYIQHQDPDQLRSQMGPAAADIAEIIPEVREKLPGLEPPPALEPEQARFRLFDSVTTFLENASQAQPLLLALDDLHWADKSSLLLLQFLTRQLGGSRLLVVGCYRDVELSRQHPLSETLAQLSREPVFRRMLLRGLSQDDTHRFLEVTAGISPTSRLVEAVHSHAEGNPFFIGEVVRLLQERGELSDEYASLPQGLRIPEGVREVIGQRLNRLSQWCNETLTIASVIGREFDFKLLRILSSEAADNELLGVLDEALKAHLIEELPGAGEQYEFTHALVQQALAEELSGSHRVRLHARIAEALEVLYGTKAEAHAAELAHHYAEARAVLGTEKLVRYSLLAGERALAAYAHEAALEHFQQGLEAKESQPMDAEKAALLFGLGRAQTGTLERFRLHEVVATIRPAFDYFMAVGDVSRALAIAQHPFSDTSVSAALARDVCQLLTEALTLVPPDSREAGRLLVRYGQVSNAIGDYEGGINALSQSLTIAQRENDLALEKRVLSQVANTHWNHLQYQECLESSLRAIQLSHRTGQLPIGRETNPHWTAVRSLIALGDIERAWQHTSELLVAAEERHDRFSLAQALHGKEVLAHLQGKWEAARDFSDQGLAAGPRDARLLNNRVMLEYQLGNFDQGNAYLERLLEAMHLAPPGGLEYRIAPLAIGVAAHITGRAGYSEVAEAAAEIILSSSYSPFPAQLVRTGLALLAVVRGDLATAEEQYVALKPWQITLTPLNLVCGHRVLGLLAQTMDQLNQAMTHFEDALAFCRQGEISGPNWPGPATTTPKL
jgi:tetratricopeptide (TPR) repeat protein